MENEIKITYRQVGDYKIPNLTLPPEAKQHIGRWGEPHAQYLNRNKLFYYIHLLSENKLWDYLAEIDKQADELYTYLVESMAKSEGVTEQLKAEDQMEWVQRMNNIQNRAREIVCNELIYT